MGMSWGGKRRLDIDIGSLRVIRAVEETGSITGAARLLGLSQPAISQHLHRAETKLGFPLLIHTGRTVKLSDAGQLLAEVSATIDGALEDTVRKLSKLASVRSGLVRIAGFPSASSTILPRLLSSLKEEHKGISIGYTEAEPPNATQMVADGDVDLAIVCSYPGDSIDLGWYHEHGLELATIFLDQMLAVLPADHPLADEKFVELADLEDDEWVAGCPVCRRYTVSACNAAGFDPQISYETDNFAAVVGFVAQGLGVAVLPRLALSPGMLLEGVRVRATRPDHFRQIQLVAPFDSPIAEALQVTMSTMALVDGSVWNLQPVARSLPAR